jgi:hypothetical protein
MARRQQTELAQEPLPWIGQERAHNAARFGLGLDQPHYHLFVLGDVGTGRSTLLQQEIGPPWPCSARCRPTCATCTTSKPPSGPRALRLPAGQGRELRQLMQAFARNLQADIPKRFAEPDFKAEVEALEKRYSDQESLAYRRCRRLPTSATSPCAAMPGS